MKTRKQLTVSVEHFDISMIRIEINQSVVRHKKIGNCFYFFAKDRDLVEVFFEPWKIKPLVRFNHHLVNYSLANINQQDHKIDFVADINYLKEYFEKNIAFKEQFLKDRNSDLNLLKDQFVGIGVDYTDLENEILAKLNK